MSTTEEVNTCVECYVLGGYTHNKVSTHKIHKTRRNFSYLLPGSAAQSDGVVLPPAGEDETIFTRLITGELWLEERMFPTGREFWRHLSVRASLPTSQNKDGYPARPGHDYSVLFLYCVMESKITGMFV